MIQDAINAAFAVIPYGSYALIQPAIVATAEAPSAQAEALTNVDVEGAISAQAGSAVADVVPEGAISAQPGSAVADAADWPTPLLPASALPAKAATQAGTQTSPFMAEFQQHHHSTVTTLAVQNWPGPDAARTKAPRPAHRIQAPRSGQPSTEELARPPMREPPPPPTL